MAKKTTKKVEMPSVSKKVRVDNYIVTKFDNGYLSVSTVGGVTLGTYSPIEMATARINDLLNNLESEPVVEGLLHNMCMNLHLAHENVLLTNEALVRIYKEYAAIGDVLNDANADEDTQSDEEILEEVEKMENYTKDTKGE